MSFLLLAQIGLVVLGAGLIAFDVCRRPVGGERAARAGLSLLSGGSIALVAFLVLNQLNFPLHLEAMEGNILQHFERAAHLEPIYPPPSPDYVALVYTPLYYLLAVPVGWVFGVNLFTLRLVAAIGMAASGLMIYLIARRLTGSRWWGIMAAGLYAASYRAMDAYLNTAHADSWLLLAALLGTYLVDRYANRSQGGSLLGVLVLVLAFWFKQQGAIFAVGGLVYLTGQEGVRRSLKYWGLAVLLGPVAFLGLGPPLLGSDLVYFTLELPGHWVDSLWEGLWRYAKAIGRLFAIPAAVTTVYMLWIGWREQARINIWHVGLVCAGLTGLSGALNTGSSDNVFVPVGVWIILVSVEALYHFSQSLSQVRRYRMHLLVLLLTFAAFLYDPRPYIMPADADKAYRDLLAVLGDLDGPVYAPWQSHLSDFELYPTPGWVALEDLIRAPGVDTRDHPTTRILLEPAINLEGPAYILTNFPLGGWPWLAFLEDYYALAIDFGTRFIALQTPPHKWDTGYPRYLYRYDPEAVRNRS